jgi:RimJ/RimL family protein N-acetyltransferase
MLESDQAELEEHLLDKEVMAPYEIPDSGQEWILRQRKRYEIDGYGSWSCRLRDTSVFIGQAGLVQKQVRCKSETTLLYFLAKRFWHNGYATEIAKGCIDYGFSQLGLKRIVAMIVPWNDPSKAVARNSKMTLECERIVWEKVSHEIWAIENSI